MLELESAMVYLGIKFSPLSPRIPLAFQPPPDILAWIPADGLSGESSLVTLTLSLWNAWATPFLKHFPQGCLPITTTSLVRFLSWVLSSHQDVDVPQASVLGCPPSVTEPPLVNSTTGSGTVWETQPWSRCPNLYSNHIFLSTLIPPFQLWSPIPSRGQVLNTGYLFLTIFPK